MQVFGIKFPNPSLKLQSQKRIGIAKSSISIANLQCPGAATCAVQERLHLVESDFADPAGEGARLILAPPPPCIRGGGKLMGGRRTRLFSATSFVA
jgi:hypothetical protein